MAWNPYLSSFMAFVCEDGSLLMADAACQVRLHGRCWQAALSSKACLCLHETVHEDMLLCPAILEVSAGKPHLPNICSSPHQPPVLASFQMVLRSAKLL